MAREQDLIRLVGADEVGYVAGVESPVGARKETGKLIDKSPSCSHPRDPDADQYGEMERNSKNSANSISARRRIEIGCSQVNSEDPSSSHRSPSDEAELRSCKLSRNGPHSSGWCSLVLDRSNGGTFQPLASDNGQVELVVEGESFAAGRRCLLRRGRQRESRGADRSGGKSLCAAVGRDPSRESSSGGGRSISDTPTNLVGVSCTSPATCTVHRPYSPRVAGENKLERKTTCSIRASSSCHCTLNGTVTSRTINTSNSFELESLFSEGVKKFPYTRGDTETVLSWYDPIRQQQQQLQLQRVSSKSLSSNVSELERMANKCLANNKFIVEDRAVKRVEENQVIAASAIKTTTTTATQSARPLEDRRATYCSSIGANTDFNYDSSFSSANNCSESNNTFTMHHQCPTDCNERQKDIPIDFAEGSGTQEPRNNPPGKGTKGSDCEEIFSHQANNKVVRIEKKRENWDKNIEFLLAVIGFAVDLGNIWRFPYICYRNGGGAFLVPYTIMFILGGLPIFYLEMSLGQYHSSGCLTVWKRICPIAKGIGYAMCVLNFFTGLYYNTIISWAVFFFVQSFTPILPWTSCNNTWNSVDCRTIAQRQVISSFIDNSTKSAIQFSRPTKDYFEREVLRNHMSQGIDDLGFIREPLAIYLAVVFVLIYFAIWKGVKSTGKAVWITALLPYFVLIPLLIRGVFLEGAWLGIHYYLYPHWLKIFDVDVWVEAAKQIYFSLGPGFGTLMALSSYNKFNHNCRRDALIAAAINYFASFISGLVIFAVLGYMATIENVNVSDVATEGPGLVFQVYPEGLATMRYSSMWSVLFFIMVITLGIDSTFGGLESVITGLCDEYPRVLRAHRGIFIGILIVIIYICSLPTTTYGGQYVIYVLESYGTSLSLLFIVLVETIIVCWLYGTDRFCSNLEEMYGERPGIYWRVCWKYISPTILLLIFICACGQEWDKYHILKLGNYVYPGWAPTIGLLMTGSSVCCIPIYAVYHMKTKVTGSFIERLKLSIKPIENERRMEKTSEHSKRVYRKSFSDKLREDNDLHPDTVI